MNREQSNKTKRVLIFPAGLGAMQVSDILLKDTSIQIVGFLDDDKNKHGKNIFGIKIIGGMDILESLFKENKFDFAVISISTSNKLRKEFYERCKKSKIPLINAIDSSVNISKDVVIGEGNVICGNSYIGTCTKIGDNNFISANASIDHHNTWGSHITTGPGVLTSGICKVGDSVKFGMNIGIQPHLKVGDNSIICSGIVVIQDIPPKSIVKKRKDYEIIKNG